MDILNAVPILSTPLMYLLEMDFGFHVREVRGALDRYYGRMLDLG